MFRTCQAEGEKAYYLSFQCNLMQCAFSSLLLLVKACHTPQKTHKHECHFILHYNTKALTFLHPAFPDCFIFPQRLHRPFEYKNPSVHPPNK